MEFPSIDLPDSKQLDYFHNESHKVRQEYYAVRNFGNEKYVPMISYHHFSSIFKFVKKETTLESKWNDIVQKVMAHAGLQFTDLATFEDRLIMPYPFFYIPEAKNILRDIREMKEKILHYKYLKFSNSLVIYLKHPEFAKEWQEFFTLVKLFADEDDIKTMGG